MHYDVIQINIFPFCNLNCKFCYERTILKKGFDKSKSYYIDKCKKAIIENNITYDKIHLLGGEIFYDKDNDFDDIINFCKWLNPKEFFLRTNLLFDFDENPLFKFLQDSKIPFKIATSYDPKNRYVAKSQEDLFFNNLRRLKASDRINTDFEIPIVLTEDLLLRKTDISTIQKLYNDYPIEFRIDLNGYSKEVTENFNKYYIEFLKDFPKCRNITEFYDKTFKKYDNKYCTCYQAKQLNLGYHRNFEVNDKFLCEGKIRNESTEELLTNNYNCNICKYNDRCSDICPEGLKLSRLLDNKKCYKQALFEHLENNMTTTNLKDENKRQHHMVQYGVWPNCVNECKFCLRAERTYYSKEKQLEILQTIRKNLDYVDWENKFDAGISLLGGELYYLTDKDLQNAFMELIDDIINKVLKPSKNLDIKYSTVTNGMYNPKFLFRVVDKLVEEVGIQHIDVNFSYDFKYRYTNEKVRKLVLKNINAFHKRYNYKVNVQMILTQFVIDMWKRGEFDYNEFIKNNIPGNHLTFLYPHPIRTDIPLDDFFFKRHDFIEFVEYLKNTNLEGYLSFIFSTWNSAKFKYTGLRDRKEDKISAEVFLAPVLSDGKEIINKSCGHSELYKCYSDSDRCMLCDIMNVIDEEGYLRGI